MAASSSTGVEADPRRDQVDCLQETRLSRAVGAPQKHDLRRARFDPRLDMISKADQMKAGDTHEWGMRDEG